MIPIMEATNDTGVYTDARNNPLHGTDDGACCHEGNRPRTLFMAAGSLAIICALFSSSYMSSEETIGSPGSTNLRSFIQTNDNGISYNPDMGSLDYTYSETVSNSVPSSSSKTYAVIHMGPHKTGSSTLQQMTGQFIQELNEDGYDMPFTERVKALHNNGVQFAACFIHPFDNFDNEEFTQLPCAFELLLAGLEIGKQGKNLLVSAEAFDKSDDSGLEALASYLSIFDEAIVTVFYRRYFEWLPSIVNQWRRRRSLAYTSEERGGFTIEDIWDFTIVDFVQQGYEQREVNALHAINVIDRVKKHFDHIEVVNMHNEKDNNEEFFCEVLPHATRTCEALKRGEAESQVRNARIELMYEDLAYNAMKHGLVAINTDEQLHDVTRAVQEYQEGTRTLNLTRNDLPMICIASEAEKWLLDVSLDIEKTLFPKFFKSPLGEERLRAEFEVHTKTDLCKLDLSEALSDKVWIDFFLNYKY